MTLKQLEAFYWAATCANFAVAAERLHLSTSSLSKRLAELEQSLGTRLFDRSGHRASLTGAGRELLPHAVKLLDQAAAARAAVAASSGLAGRCVFGVGELSALTWLPHFIASARQLYPQLILQPQIEVGAQLEEKLANGELDCAVVAGRSSRQALLSQVVTRAEFVWCAASFAETDGVAQALQSGQPLIALPPAAGTTRLIDDWLLQHEIEPQERIDCNNWGAIAGLLSSGVGVGILPSGWAHQLAARGLLQIAQADNKLNLMPYSFQWRRGDARPLIAKMQALAMQTADFSAGGFLPLKH